MGSKKRLTTKVAATQTLVRLRGLDISLLPAGLVFVALGFGACGRIKRLPTKVAATQTLVRLRGLDISLLPAGLVFVAPGFGACGRILKRDAPLHTWVLEASCFPAIAITITNNCAIQNLRHQGFNRGSW